MTLRKPVTRLSYGWRAQRPTRHHNRFPHREQTATPNVRDKVGRRPVSSSNVCADIVFANDEDSTCTSGHTAMPWYTQSRPNRAPYLPRALRSTSTSTTYGSMTTHFLYLHYIINTSLTLSTSIECDNPPICVNVSCATAP